jgi:hypothetical protein
VFTSQDPHDNIGDIEGFSDWQIRGVTAKTMGSPKGPPRRAEKPAF